MDRHHTPLPDTRLRWWPCAAALCFVAVFCLSAVNKALLSECWWAGHDLGLFGRRATPDYFSYPLAALVQTGAFALLWLSALLVSWHWARAARRAALLALTAAFLGLMHLWSEEVLSELAGHFEFFLNGP